MASCEKITLDFERLIFKEVRKDTPDFQYLVRYFNSQIAPLYGDQSKALKKIAAHKDRTCELLQTEEENLGIIVYKHSLTQEFKSIGHENVFEIKTLVVINPVQNSGKKIAMRLMHRIAQQATEKNAASIYVTVSSAKPESLAFFLGRGFIIERTIKNAYVQGLHEYHLFHPSPQKLLSSTSLELLTSIPTQSRIQLNQNPTKRFSLTTVEKLILYLYFKGKNTHQISKCVFEYLGIKPPSSLILDTITFLRQHNLKWQPESLEHHYRIVFLNPLFYANKNSKEAFGQLLIGITSKGKKHVLACLPAKRLPQSYWIGILQDLKNSCKVEEIDILSTAPTLDLSLALHRTFPSATFVTSENLKTWTVENLLPKSTAMQLVEELVIMIDIINNESLTLEHLVSSM